MQQASSFARIVAEKRRLSNCSIYFPLGEEEIIVSNSFETAVSLP
jgi:hypothetical protein